MASSSLQGDSREEVPEEVSRVEFAIMWPSGVHDMPWHCLSQVRSITLDPQNRKYLRTSPLSPCICIYFTSLLPCLLITTKSTILFFLTGQKHQRSVVVLVQKVSITMIATLFRIAAEESSKKNVNRKLRRIFWLCCWNYALYWGLHTSSYLSTFSLGYCRGQFP